MVEEDDALEEREMIQTHGLTYLESALNCYSPIVRLLDFKMAVCLI